MSDDPRPSLSRADWHQLRSNRFFAGWSNEAITKACDDWIVQQMCEDAYRIGLAKGNADE